MERISELSAWVAKTVAEKTNEWDWKVSISVEPPEEHQTNYQIFLTMEKLALKIVLLLDEKFVKAYDLLTIEEKIDGAFKKLQGLAEERVTF